MYAKNYIQDLYSISILISHFLYLYTCVYVLYMCVYISYQN